MTVSGAPGATRVLAINGSLTPGHSRTRALLDVALDSARASRAGVQTGLLDLREFALDFCDGRPTEQYGADTRRALALIGDADAYLVATPVYRASYTGALKNLFDLVPNDPDGADPLRNKAVALIASGGSAHHYLVLEHQLRPLFGFFGCHTLGRAIYATPADYDQRKQPTGYIVDALRHLGRELVASSEFLRMAGATASAHLRIQRT